MKLSVEENESKEVSRESGWRFKIGTLVLCAILATCVTQTRAFAAAMAQDATEQEGQSKKQGKRKKAAKASARAEMEKKAQAEQQSQAMKQAEEARTKAMEARKAAVERSMEAFKKAEASHYAAAKAQAKKTDSKKGDDKQSSKMASESGWRNSGAQRIVWIKVDRTIDPEIPYVFFSTFDPVDTDGDETPDKRHFYTVLLNSIPSKQQVKLLSDSLTDLPGTKGVKFDMLVEFTKDSSMVNDDPDVASGFETMKSTHIRVSNITAEPYPPTIRPKASKTVKSKQ